MQPATTKAAVKKTSFSRARAATNFALMNEAEVPQYDAGEDQGAVWMATIMCRHSCAHHTQL